MCTYVHAHLCECAYVWGWELGKGKEGKCRMVCAALQCSHACRRSHSSEYAKACCNPWTLQRPWKARHKYSPCTWCRPGHACAPSEAWSGNGAGRKRIPHHQGQSTSFRLHQQSRSRFQVCTSRGLGQRAHMGCTTVELGCSCLSLCLPSAPGSGVEKHGLRRAGSFTGMGTC